MPDNTSPSSNGLNTPRQGEYALPPWWMIWLLACLSAVFGIGLFFGYAWHFPNGFSVKRQLSRWGINSQFPAPERWFPALQSELTLANS